MDIFFIDYYDEVLDKNCLRFLEINIPLDIQGSEGLIDLLNFFVTSGKKVWYSVSKVERKLLVASCTQFCSIT